MHLGRQEAVLLLEGTGKMAGVGVADVPGDGVDGLASLLDQGQRGVQAQLAHAGGNAHACALAKGTLQVALVEAHTARQVADGEVPCVLGVDDVEGIADRTLPAMPVAGGGRPGHLQPQAQQRNGQPFDLQAPGQGGGRSVLQQGLQAQGDAAHGGRQVLGVVMGGSPGRIQIVLEAAAPFAIGQVFLPACEQFDRRRDVGLRQAAGQHGGALPVLQAGEGPEFVMAVALVGLPPAIDPFDAAAHHHLQAHGGGKRVAAGVEAGDGLVQVGRQHAGHQAIVEGLRIQVAPAQPPGIEVGGKVAAAAVQPEAVGRGQALRVPGDVPDEAVEELSAGRQGGLRAVVGGCHGAGREVLRDGGPEWGK